MLKLNNVYVSIKKSLEVLGRVHRCLLCGWIYSWRVNAAVTVRVWDRVQNKLDLTTIAGGYYYDARDHHHLHTRGSLVSNGCEG